MPLDARVSFQSGTKQIIEVAVWKRLDIKIQRCALDRHLRMADNVYFSLSDRESFQRVVLFFGFGHKAFDASTRTKRIRELANRKNAFDVQPRPVFVREIGEET